MKVARRRGAARAGGARGRRSGSARPPLAIRDRLRARRQADHLRQRRLGHRRQRLGDRLRRAAAGHAAGARDLARRWSRPTSRAIANDVGAESIFLRQLIAQARPGDVAVAISTSGGSRNVIAALDEARKRGLLTVALLGYDGGEIGRRGLADHCRSWCRSRLHPAHPGGAGVDLPRDAREPGGARPMAHA